MNLQQPNSNDVSQTTNRSRSVVPSSGLCSERLARELHDNLGQVLGYASFQLEAAAKLNRNGQAETAADQLDCLANVIRETHADVRQFILNLRSTPCLDVPFITRLQQHLDGFTNNYAIQAYLTVDIKMNGKTYSPDMQMQILRIMQEALWNARKHSHAHRVQVKLEAEDGQTRMTIEDDGCGFSLDKLEKLDVQHFGLRFMQERAAQMGGSLQLQSTPGKGTRVTLLIPGKDL